MAYVSGSFFGEPDPWWCQGHRGASSFYYLDQWLFLLGLHIVFLAYYWCSKSGSGSGSVSCRSGGQPVNENTGSMTPPAVTRCSELFSSLAMSQRQTSGMPSKPATAVQY